MTLDPLTLERLTQAELASMPADERPELDRIAEAAEHARAALSNGGPPKNARVVDGAAFALDAPETVPAICGRGEDVLWAEGEALLLVAPPGVGKTTMLGQLTLGSVGVESFTSFLNYPIRPVEDGKVVYVAADRPLQAARSFRRMVSEADRELLVERLTVWRGPLPFDLAREPERFVSFCKALNARWVMIDSLGAVGFDLASDEGGARVAAALNEAAVEGIQVAASHHDRKREQGTDRVRSLDDVYGSRWITAAAGSVVYLDGRAGDLIVKLRHLKQPAGEIGPLRIRHDHQLGRTEVYEGADLLKLAENGITVKDAAGALFEVSTPSANEVEKARYRLDRLADRGDMERLGDEQPIVYLTSQSGGQTGQNPSGEGQTGVRPTQSGGGQNGQKDMAQTGAPLRGARRPGGSE